MPKRSKSIWLVMLGLGAASCAPKPEFVYIDLAKVPPYPQEAPEYPARAGTETLESVAGSIESLGSRELSSGDLAKRAELAQSQIEENSRQLFEEIRKRLVADGEAQLKVTADEESQKLSDAYQDELDTIITRIERAFVRRAMLVGDYTYDLARIVGFPDPDPKSRRGGVMSDDPEALKEAKWLRWEVARLRSETKLLANRLLDDARSNLRAAQAELDVDMGAERTQMMSRAEAEARLAALDNVERTINPAFDPNQLLEPLDGIATTVPGDNVSPPLWPWTTPTAKTLWANRLKDQAKIYAESRGWQLAERPSGARDATKEFIEWRQKQQGKN